MTKINIAELDIDVRVLLERQSDVLQMISKLVKEQKELTKATDEYENSNESLSKKLKEITDRIVTLTKEYKANKKILLEHMEAVQKEIGAIALRTTASVNLSQALKNENSAIKTATSNTNDLAKSRGKLNTAIGEGKSQLDGANTKLVDNSAYIRDNKRAVDELYNSVQALNSAFKGESGQNNSGKSLDNVKEEMALLREKSIYQEESNAIKMQQDEEAENKQREKADNEKREKEAAKADEALAFELKVMEEDNEFERKRMQLERDKAEELRVAEEMGRDKSLIEQKYAKKKEEIDEAENKSKLGRAADAAGQVADLLGKETVAGKAAAVAQATINTYQGASAALKMGMPMGAVFAALTIAAGLKTVAQITGVKLPKAERGMSFEIGGRRHFAGGTLFRGTDGSMFEAEKGEQLFILNRGASAEYRQNLSALNMKHGGQSLYSLRRDGYYERGGQVVTTNQDYSDVINAFEKSQFVVQVVDIADGLNHYGNTVDINTWAL